MKKKLLIAVFTVMVLLVTVLTMNSFGKELNEFVNSDLVYEGEIQNVGEIFVFLYQYYRMQHL